MEEDLDGLVSSAKFAIIHYLLGCKTCIRQELEPYVLSVINMKLKKDETIQHETKPIHALAFIMAYKELEAEDRIKINRSVDVHFPMTDYKTLFSLC